MITCSNLNALRYGLGSMRALSLSLSLISLSLSLCLSLAPVCVAPVSYYHMFKEGELESLVGQVPGCRIVRSGLDHQNWFVVVEKLT